MQISCDGMSESRSTSISLDVYSSRLKNCQVIFPHKIVRPLGKYQIDHKEQLSSLVQNLIENGDLIETYVADNLKRAVARSCLCFSSTFPCEYCFARGVRFKIINQSAAAKKQLQKVREQIKNLTGGDGDSEQLAMLEKELQKTEKQLKGTNRSHIVWPSSTSNAEPRTPEKMLEIIEKLEERGGKLPADEAKGVVGRSVLFMIPGFDFVVCVPTEYLHSVCLGVGKRLLELTFDVGEKRSRITTRKLTNPSLFNDLMRHVKVLREFARRSRELDFSVLKGQEFRNIVIFFFPLVLDCLEENAEERKLWLWLAFMIRACILPEQEFSVINLTDIETWAKNFYNLYEKLFGEKNCTYNTHIVCSHILEMRFQGPLTFTSAFGFESFYGEIRASFTPGTPSTLKQIFKKILMKRALSHHCCKNSIYFSDHETSLENDTLIYCYKQRSHDIFKVTEVTDNHVFCRRIGKYPHSFDDLPNLNCAQVGIYKKGLLSDEKIKIKKEDIDGKVLDVCNLLITCPNNVLREK